MTFEVLGQKSRKANNLNKVIKLNGKKKKSKINVIQSLNIWKIPKLTRKISRELVEFEGPIHIKPKLNPDEVINA